MSMPDWLFAVEIVAYVILLSAWPRFRTINFFSFSQAIPVPVFVLAMLLIVQGWIGSGIGAFAVVWKDPADTANPFAMWEYAIFWNGFALSLYFLVLAYLVYLLYAQTYPEKKNLEERLSAVACLAVPSLLVMSEKEITAKYGLTETDKYDSAFYLRWRHNNAQYEIFREQLRDYFPIRRPAAE